MFNQNGGNNFNGNNNGGFGGNNQQQKPKTNFNFGTIKATDGKMKIGAWKSEYGVSAKMSILAVRATDPSTNQPIYEATSPIELPQGILGRDKLKTFIELVKQNDYKNLNFELPGTTVIKVSTEGINTKITLTSSKLNLTRSITLEAIENNGKIINASLMSMIKWFERIYDISCGVGVADTEFAETNSSDSNQGTSDDSPF